MPLTERLYKQNQTIIKVLGFGENKTIKVVNCNYLRTSGLVTKIDKKYLYDDHLNSLCINAKLDKAVAYGLDLTTALKNVAQREIDIPFIFKNWLNGVECGYYTGFLQTKSDYEKTFINKYECNVAYNELLDEDISNVNCEEQKLANNISRAKTKIFEYAYCNPWTYFFTGTIDATKLDRKNLDNFREKFSQFVRNQNKKYKCNIKYLIVPELHKDGENWHIHGFLYGLPKESIAKYDKNKGYKINKSILALMDKDVGVYYWKDYQNKFGFCNMTEIVNQEACAKYITKYIKKDLGVSIKELNAHLYYCSKGLDTGQVIEKGTLYCDYKVPMPLDFQSKKKSSYIGEFTNIETYEYSDELLEYLCRHIIHTKT